MEKIWLEGDIEINLSSLRKYKLSRTDKSHIVSFCMEVDTGQNVLYNGIVPHTITTLSQKMEMHYSTMTRLINRFVGMGIMAKMELYGTKVYVMNPFLCKRMESISTDTIDYFRNQTFE